MWGWPRLATVLLVPSALWSTGQRDSKPNSTFYISRNNSLFTHPVSLIASNKRTQPHLGSFTHSWRVETEATQEHTGSCHPLQTDVWRQPGAIKLEWKPQNKRRGKKEAAAALLVSAPLTHWHCHVTLCHPPPGRTPPSSLLLVTQRHWTTSHRPPTPAEGREGQHVLICNPLPFSSSPAGGGGTCHKGRMPN